MNYKISIISPCYNSGRFIDQTIKSVLGQTYTNWEWFIIDDKSSDNSVQVIQSYTDPRIKLIQLDQNRGAAYARNQGILRASGRFITFIDSDDLWDADFLERTTNFLLQNNAELVYTSYRRVDEQVKPILDDFIAEDKITYKRLLKNCPIPMLSSMYDCSRIGTILIPQEVHKREDYAMWLIILQKIPMARAIKAPLATYRIRKNSSSRNKFSMAKAQFLVYYNFLKFPLYKSSYYTLLWAYNGLIKYGKI